MKYFGVRLKNIIRVSIQHSMYCRISQNKAELLQEGIFFPHPFIYQRRFAHYL